MKEQYRNSGFWLVFSHEMKTVLSSPKKLLWCLGVPLGIFFLYISIFGNGILHHLPLAIIDKDHSVLSREITRQLQANPTLQFSESVNSENEAVKLLKTSKIFGFVVIPGDFEKNLNRGISQDIVLYVNNDYLTPGGLIYKAFSTTIATFSATVKVSTLMKSGSSTRQAATIVQPVVVDSHTLFNPYINYAYYLCLSLFPMALQLTVMANTIFILGSVLKHRKGRELYHRSNNNIWNAYWGTTLPYTFLFMFLAFVMISILFGYMQIPVNTSLGSIYILTVILIVVYQLMAVFFVAISKDFRSLCSFGGGYSALSYSFSGYTFPAESMPTAIKILDVIFPYVTYTRILTNTAVKGMPLASSSTYLVGFALFAVIGILSLGNYKLMLQKGHYDDE